MSLFIPFFNRKDVHQHTLPFCYIAQDWAQVVGWDAVAQTVGLYDETMAQTVGLYEKTMAQTVGLYDETLA